MGLASWRHLSDAERAQVVVFIRTAEDEGAAYAAEHYPPKFPEGSVLVGARPEDLIIAFRTEYESLSPEDFWRLYELGTA